LSLITRASNIVPSLPKYSLIFSSFQSFGT